MPGLPACKSCCCCQGGIHQARPWPPPGRFNMAKEPGTYACGAAGRVMQAYLPHIGPAMLVLGQARESERSCLMVMYPVML